MAQIQMAGEFDKRIAERLKMTMKTEIAVNHNYKFDGSDTVHITSVDTVPLVNYQKSGTSRYGTPLDLGDTEQVVTLSRDRSFTFIIDKGDVQDQKIQKTASDAMRRETDEVINPELETYRLSVMASKPGYIAVDSNLATISGGATYIYSDILTMNAAATNALAPDTGRVMFMTPEAIAMLLQSDGKFLQYGNVSQEMKIKGEIGEIDGCKIIQVPAAFMPANCVVLMAHKDATVAVEKLKDFTIHENPPGINGNLVEGRLRYDAFVLDTKVPLLGCIYSAGTLLAAPTITDGGVGTGVTITAGTGATIKYTVDGSDPRDSLTAQTYSAAVGAAWTANGYETTIKAVAIKAGSITSTVATKKVAYAPALTRKHGV